MGLRRGVVSRAWVSGPGAIALREAVKHRHARITSRRWCGGSERGEAWRLPPRLAVSGTPATGRYATSCLPAPRWDAPVRGEPPPRRAGGRSGSGPSLSCRPPSDMVAYPPICCPVNPSMGLRPANITSPTTFHTALGNCASIADIVLG
jgi:hypothetical protein